MRLHWYSLSFMALHGRCTAVGNCYRGFERKSPALTRAVIRALAEAVDIGPNPILLSVSYVGHMTKEEFTAE